jgi:ribonuclease III
MADRARLQGVLGYQFGDPDLLSLALTHSSAGKNNNERLEFLGDSIINHIIAEALYHYFPFSREGEMTRMRAALVRKSTLAEVATDLQLGDFLRLGIGERKSGGHRRSSALADTLEAIAAAILLDGGVDECRRCVLAWFGSRVRQVSAVAEKDAKTRLQEYLQARSNTLPEYEVLSVSGESSAQLYQVACRLQILGIVVEGTGATRRDAEQNAATSALERLSAHGN